MEIIKYINDYEFYRELKQDIWNKWANQIGIESQVLIPKDFNDRILYGNYYNQANFYYFFNSKLTKIVLLNLLNNLPVFKGVIFNFQDDKNLYSEKDVFTIINLCKQNNIKFYFLLNNKKSFIDHFPDLYKELQGDELIYELRDF